MPASMFADQHGTVVDLDGSWFYSTIVEGELRALAKVWRWGQSKLDELDEILAELVRVDAGLPDIVKAYAEIYAADQTLGKKFTEAQLEAAIIHLTW